MNDSFTLRKPAIRVQQRIGGFWATSIPASILLEYTVPDPLRLVVDPSYENTDDWKRHIRLLGNQRPLRDERLRSIAEYVDGIDSTFPNSIILAAPSEEGVPGDGKPWRLQRNADNVDYLIIPEGASKATVVDGQHRLYSFLYTEIEQRKDFELLCAIFFDIPQTLQAYIFATINTNQKAVRRGMALNMYGYNIEDEPRELWSPEKLAVFLVRRLNYDQQSALYSRIKIDAKNAPSPQLLPGACRPLPMASVVDGILRLISQSPVSDRDALRSERLWSRIKRAGLPTDNSPLRSWYLSCNDASIYELVRGFLGLVDELYWREAPAKSVLTRAVGIRAIFDFVTEALRRNPAIYQEWSNDSRKQLSLIRTLLSMGKSIDFSDPFFEATGRGQKRISASFMICAKWVEIASFPEQDRVELHRLTSLPL